jgi:hypothetical protein
VPAARPGAAQHPRSAIRNNGDWSATGQRFDTAVVRLDAALAALPQSTFRGVLWSQGERDAQAIDAGTITTEQYRAEFVAMIGRFRAKYGPTMPFWIFQTGDKPGSKGFAAVRAVQQAVADADPYTWIVFGGAKGFAARGMMADDLHYTQQGYNEMGTVGGRAVAELTRLRQGAGPQ